LTDQAHIIETGTESYRFRRTLEKKGGKKSSETVIERRQSSAYLLAVLSVA
jgi:hypothetical protein